MPKCDFHDYKYTIQKISKFTFIKEHFLFEKNDLKKCLIFRLEYSK
jgi:hypothetical protein